MTVDPSHFAQTFINDHRNRSRSAVHFDEFSKFYAKSFADHAPEDDVRHTFELMDPTGQGYVDSSTFAQVMTGLIASDFDGDLDAAKRRFQQLIDEAFPQQSDSLYARLWHQKNRLSYDAYMHFLSC